jgi:hypothetical protein
MVKFISNFKITDTERQRQLKTKSTGYHAIAAKSTVVNAKTNNNSNNNGTQTLYHCWTHGAGPNANHTLQTCNVPAATIFNMIGGNITIHQLLGKQLEFDEQQKKVTLNTTTTSPPK